MTTTALAERYAELTYEDLPAEVVRRAKEALLDTLGVTVGGQAHASARTVAEFAADLGGREESSVVGSGRVPAPYAALVNATMAHTLELDDVDNASSLHPGTVVIPAALALGESVKASGEQVLTAIIAGYDAIIRIGRATGPAQQYGKGFHPTATCGPFGAAVAAGSILGLSPSAMAHALGIAGSFTSGNLEYMANGAWTKRLQVGGAAHAGLVAALLAARGYTGPTTILEGEHGFMQSHSDAPRPEVLGRDLAHPYAILEVSIKPFACCRYNQTPIDATLELAETYDLQPDEVSSIDVEIVSAGYPIVAEPRSRKLTPQNSVDGQFSLPYSVAVALRHRAAFVDEFSDQSVRDPKTRELAGLVRARPSPELDAFYPERWPAHVRIEMADGRVYELLAKSCRGDPDKPLSRDALQDKFRALTRDHLDEGLRADMIAAIDDLEAAGPGRLMEITRNGGGGS